MNARMEDVVQMLLEDYRHDRTVDRGDAAHLPDRTVVAEGIGSLLQMVFPGYFGGGVGRSGHGLPALMERTALLLSSQISLALGGDGQETARRAMDITLDFFSRIPQVRALVQTDLQAAWDGDPAATGYDEVILCYPGLLAVTVYRLAHALYACGVPLIPRMMTEHAHSLTGIDIHPGADIGPWFFIDHGTGIVIGETTVIGEHVKIYQGVTLGGLSTRAGQGLRGTKRHPTIGDHVTIYANASILGGDTVIGAGATVGANAFITASVAPGTTVTMKEQEHSFRFRTER